MNDIGKPKLTVIDGQASTTSLAVAEHFGKRHDNVLRDIGNVLRKVSEEVGLLNFKESSYVNAQGKAQPMFRLTRTGFEQLSMGFEGPKAKRWRWAYMSAFELMAQALHRPAGGVAAKLLQAAELARSANEATLGARRQLCAIATEAMGLAREQMRQALDVTGAEEQGLALLLTGMRVPDGPLFVALAQLSHARRMHPGGQWVRISRGDLARQIGVVSVAQVDAALDRLRVSRLVERRQAPDGLPPFEYRADMGAVQTVLNHLRADPGRAPVVRQFLAKHRLDGVARLFKTADSSLGRIAGAVYRWNQLHGQMAGRGLEGSAAPWETWSATLRSLALPSAAPARAVAGVDDTPLVGWNEAARSVERLHQVVPSLPDHHADELDAPRIVVIDGAATTTSIEIARFFGKRHDNVLQTIRNAMSELPEDEISRLKVEESSPKSPPGSQEGNRGLLKVGPSSPKSPPGSQEGNRGRSNFEAADYLDEQGKPRLMYRLTRKAFNFAVTGFKGPAAERLKLAYIEAFHRMETALLAHEQQISRNLAETVRIGLAGCQDLRDAEQQTLGLLSEAVDVVSALGIEADSVSGAHELGAALDLTGMRVPDAQLLLVLARHCLCGDASGAPQWVRLSCRALAGELGWSTPGRVRAATLRLEGMGLIQRQVAAQAQPHASASRRSDLAYRVDLGRAKELATPRPRRVAQLPGAVVRLLLPQSPFSVLTHSFELPFGAAAPDSARQSVLGWQRLHDLHAQCAAATHADLAPRLQGVRPVSQLAVKSEPTVLTAPATRSAFASGRVTRLCDPSLRHATT